MEPPKPKREPKPKRLKKVLPWAWRHRSGPLSLREIPETDRKVIEMIADGFPRRRISEELEVSHTAITKVRLALLGRIAPNRDADCSTTAIIARWVAEQRIMERDTGSSPEMP